MASLLRRASSNTSNTTTEASSLPTSQHHNNSRRRYMLKLTPIRARELLPKPSRNSYCTLVLLDADLQEIKGEKQRTPAAKGENPIWSPLKLEMTRVHNQTLGLAAAAANEEYTFGKTCDLQNDAKYVLVKCKDKGVVETEDLGRLLLSLDELDTSGTERVAWYSLQLRPNGKMSSVQGALQVSCRIVREPSTWQLWKCASQMVRELDIRDRSHYLKLHAQCFTGSSAVEWLLRHGPQRSTEGGITISTEEEAILLGDCMIRAGIMSHVSNDIRKPFVNNVRQFYRFAVHATEVEAQNASLDEMTRVLALGPDHDDEVDKQLFGNPSKLNVSVPSSASSSTVTETSATLLSKLSSTNSSSSTGTTPTQFYPGAGASSAVSSKRKLKISDFELLRVLSSNTHGRVLSARSNLDKNVYAIKVTYKTGMDDANRKDAKTERDLLRQVHHPFVATLAFAFQNEDKLYLGMEFYNGGDLRHHMVLHSRNELPLLHDRICFYAAELVAGIAHLHSLDLAYQNLRPENVLLASDGHVKLVDFNLSKLGDKKRIGIIGEIDVMCAGSDAAAAPLDYIAPEILIACNGGGNDSSSSSSIGFDKSCDWWSLGIIIFEMYIGRTPFKDASRSIMYRNIVEGNIFLPDELPEDARSLLSGLIKADPEARLGSKEAVPFSIMQHPYFANINWDTLLAKDIAPPWVPDVLDAADTKYIDDEYANQVPMDTPEWRMLDSVDREREQILDYTFQASEFK